MLTGVYTNKEPGASTRTLAARAARLTNTRSENWRVERSPPRQENPRGVDAFGDAGVPVYFGCGLTPAPSSATWIAFHTSASDLLASTDTMLAWGK
jgi:hypothetical protein